MYDIYRRSVLTHHLSINGVSIPPQVGVVIAVVFSVLLYRLAIAGLLYRAVSGIAGGPSIGDIAVSITGAMIQLVAIIVMNRLYEFLAYKLTNWGS